jgi:hypothetical protein
LESFGGSFVVGATRAAAWTRFVIRELVSMRDSEDAVDMCVVPDRATLGRPSVGRCATLGCRKVTVSTRSPVAGLLVYSAAR